MVASTITLLNNNSTRSVPSGKSKMMNNSSRSSPSARSRGKKRQQQQQQQPQQQQLYSPSNHFNYSREVFYEVALALKENLPVEDRTYHFKTYKNCFVGRDAIDFLYESSFLQLGSRREAVLFAWQMNNTVHFCEHVAQDHGNHVKDEHLFYRFTEFDKQKTFTLEECTRALQRGLRLQDRTYRMKKYNRVFTGTQAVDYLVEHNYATTRNQAVELGRLLATKFDLFVHVTGEHELKDEPLYYRMLVPKIQKESEGTQLGLQTRNLLVEDNFLKTWIGLNAVLAVLIYCWVF